MFILCFSSFLYELKVFSNPIVCLSIFPAISQPQSILCIIYSTLIVFCFVSSFMVSSFVLFVLFFFLSFSFFPFILFQNFNVFSISFNCCLLFLLPHALNLTLHTNVLLCKNLLYLKKLCASLTCAIFVHDVAFLAGNGSNQCV